MARMLNSLVRRAITPVLYEWAEFLIGQALAITFRRAMAA